MNCHWWKNPDASDEDLSFLDDHCVYCGYVRGKTKSMKDVHSKTNCTNPIILHTVEPVLFPLIFKADELWKTSNKENQQLTANQQYGNITYEYENTNLQASSRLDLGYLSQVQEMEAIMKIGSNTIGDVASPTKKVATVISTIKS